LACLRVKEGDGEGGRPGEEGRAAAAAADELWKGRCCRVGFNFCVVRRVMEEATGEGLPRRQRSCTLPFNTPSPSPSPSPSVAVLHDVVLVFPASRVQVLVVSLLFFFFPLDMHVRLAGGFGHVCSFSWWLVAVRVKTTESIRLAT
jgi:hypothetical protein